MTHQSQDMPAAYQSSPTLKSRLGANALTWGAGTVLSRVLALARDLGIAALLGAGPVADAFFVAFRLPDFMRRIFGEGVWSMVFVPAFLAMSEADSGHRQRGFALARAVFIWLLLLVGGACLLAMVLAPWLLGMLAPGFGHNPELLDRAVTLFRICAPYALLVMCTALSVALLNALGRFLLPSLAPVLLNAVMLLGLLTAWLLDASGYASARALAWSVLAGGLVQWLAQLPALRGSGFAWRGPLRLRDPAVRRLGREALPALLGVSCFQITALLATFLATLQAPGAVAWLYFAERLVQLPLGLFSVTVSVAALPELSLLASLQDEQNFQAVLRRGLGLVLWCSLPAMAGLLALGRPIVELLFGHGAFTAEAVRGTASMLHLLAPGIPALAAVRPLTAACNARQDRGTPLKAMLAGLGCFLLLVWPCIQLAQASGLALALSLAGWVNAALLLFALHRQGASLFCKHMRTDALLTLLLTLGVFAGALLLRILEAKGIALLAGMASLAAGYVLLSRCLGLGALQRKTC